jgi:hypothetical protein
MYLPRHALHALGSTITIDYDYLVDGSARAARTRHLAPLLGRARPRNYTVQARLYDIKQP